MAAEPSIRKQLVAARATIIEQLFQLRSPAGLRGLGLPDGGRPDNRSVIAALEGELREIEAMLGDDEAPGR